MQNWYFQLLTLASRSHRMTTFFFLFFLSFLSFFRSFVLSFFLPLQPLLLPKYFVCASVIAISLLRSSIYAPSPWWVQYGASIRPEQRCTYLLYCKIHTYLRTYILSYLLTYSTESCRSHPAPCQPGVKSSPLWNTSFMISVRHVQQGGSVK
jgi:hypothetical protein